MGAYLEESELQRLQERHGEHVLVQLFDDTLGPGICHLARVLRSGLFNFFFFRRMRSKRREEHRTTYASAVARWRGGIFLDIIKGDAVREHLGKCRGDRVGGRQLADGAYNPLHCGGRVVQRTGSCNASCPYTLHLSLLFTPRSAIPKIHRTVPVHEVWGRAGINILRPERAEEIEAPSARRAGVKG